MSYRPKTSTKMHLKKSTIRKHSTLLSLFVLRFHLCRSHLRRIVAPCPCHLSSASRTTKRMPYCSKTSTKLMHLKKSSKLSTPKKSTKHSTPKKRTPTGRTFDRLCCRIVEPQAQSPKNMLGHCRFRNLLRQPYRAMSRESKPNEWFGETSKL